MNNLIAINICIDDRLINTNKIPMLFNSDNDDFINDMISDESFIEWLEKNEIFRDANTYSSASLSYFKYDVESESYLEDSQKIQSIIDIVWIEKNYEKFIISISKEVFKYLYRKAFNEEYDFEKYKMFENDICNRLKVKFGDKMSNTVILNAVENYIANSYSSLSNENKIEIIEYCKKKMNC